MNVVLGAVLPLAVAVAISPVPIIATILMLMSPRPRPLGLGFLLGWVAGIAIGVVVFTLLAGILPAAGGDGPQPVIGVIQLVLGLLLVLLAIKQWRGRPRLGEQAELPKWMAAIDGMRPGAAIGLAFLLSAVNPKNLLVLVAAGAAIGHAGLGAGSVTIVIAVFVLIAAISVLVPVLLFLVAPAKAAVVLDRVRIWLVANNAVIMAVLLVVIGAQLLGNGIGSM
ncbi:MAG: GAP family protein [Actinobacteria bacterium]|nr:GAP family protein [Actinomycetota bacterium]